MLQKIRLIDFFIIDVFKNPQNPENAKSLSDDDFKHFFFQFEAYSKIKLQTVVQAPSFNQNPSSLLNKSRPFIKTRIQANAIKTSPAMLRVNGSFINQNQLFPQV